MRLRLHIFRNELPALKLVWETSTALAPGVDDIVSNLLASINAVIPLECSTWGLEDYVVELGGFEVLHFQEVTTVFKEDDEVVIRPLSNSEVKQRRLSGRRQISSSGRKLLDGTPFGRSYIRPAPDRPPLMIPSAKRSRSGRGIETSTLQMQTEDSEDEDVDYDYEPVRGEGAGELRQELMDKASREDVENTHTAVVRFASPRADSNDDDESDDSSFRASDSGSESESGSETDSEAESVAEHEEAAAPKPKHMAVESSPNRSSSSRKSSTEEESESSSDESSGGEAPEARTSKRKREDKPAPKPPSPKKAKGPGTAPGTLPYQGAPATKARNARKKIRKMMKRVQSKGLAKDFTITRMKAFLADHGLSLHTPDTIIIDFLEKDSSAQAPESQSPTTKIHEKAAVREVHEKTGISEGANKEPPKPVETVVAAKKPEKAQKKKLQRMAEMDSVKHSLKSDLLRIHSSTGSEAAQEQCHTPQPTTKQAKADGVLEAQRLSINTYGKSNKKWKTIRDKPSNKTVYDQDGNPSTIAVSAEETPTVLEGEHEKKSYEPEIQSANPEAWRNTIWLSAVECEQPNVQLPAPDFPFSQNQLHAGTGTAAKGKKRKRGKNQQKSHAEEYEEFLASETAQTLNHEGPQTNGHEQVENDLPALPKDVSTLPDLIKPLLRGTVIAFKQFKLGKSYEPILTDYQTAIVENVFNDEPNGPRVEMKLAIRDRPEVEYDEETGEKVRGKFDMPGYDEDEESGFLDLMWGEMLEPKLVKLPEEGVEPPAPQETQQPQQKEKEPIKDHSHLDIAPESVETGYYGDNEVSQIYGGNDNGELDYGEDIHMSDQPNHETAARDLRVSDWAPVVEDTTLESLNYESDQEYDPNKDYRKEFQQSMLDQIVPETTLNAHEEEIAYPNSSEDFLQPERERQSSHPREQSPDREPTPPRQPNPKSKPKPCNQSALTPKRTSSRSPSSQPSLSGSQPPVNPDPVPSPAPQKAQKSKVSSMLDGLTKPLSSRHTPPELAAHRQPSRQPSVPPPRSLAHEITDSSQASVKPGPHENIQGATLPQSTGKNEYKDISLSTSSESDSSESEVEVERKKKWILGRRPRGVGLRRRVEERR